MSSTQRRFVAVVLAAAVALVAAAQRADAQQTLTRNALTAANNTLGNLSGWSTAATASGVTPTSITASDTLSFTNWWTPGKLSTAQLWFDPADLGSVTVSSGLVSQINNKASGSLTGGATRVEQSNSTLRPTYNTSGSNTLNGLPSMSFDGTADYLRTDGTFSSAGWSQMTLVSVNKGPSAMFNLGYGAPGGSMLNIDATNGNVQFAGRPTGGSSYQVATAGPVNRDAPSLSGISYLTWNGNNMVAYANGVAGTALAASPSANLTQFNQWFEIGAISNLGAYRQATSGEVVVTNSSNTEQRQLLEGYMAWKWGTQSLLANDHPYKNAPPVSTSETYYTGGNQSAAGLNFGAAGSATTLLGGTSATAAANTMTLGAGGITVAAGVGATTLGAASGATVSLVVGADQTWTNNSGNLLRAHNGISRAAGDTTNRQLTIAGTGETRLDGVIADGGSSGTLGLLKQGAGKLVLAAANTFTGATAITGGTLELLAGASLASSELNIGSGGTLKLLTGSSLTSSAINVGLGGVFDSSAGSFTLGNGRSIGGTGSMLGNLVFGSGSSFQFTPGETLQLTLSSGTASFTSTFGIANILGIDETTPEGIYTLIDGTVNFTNVVDVGPENAVPIGDGSKTAYLQQGSLQLVVVPEPAAVTLAGMGVIGIALALRRRHAAR